jgi:multidrug resistance efflux pump
MDNESIECQRAKTRLENLSAAVKIAVDRLVEAQRTCEQLRGEYGGAASEAKRLSGIAQEASKERERLYGVYIDTAGKYGPNDERTQGASLALASADASLHRAQDAYSDASTAAEAAKVSWHTGESNVKAADDEADKLARARTQADYEMHQACDG